MYPCPGQQCICPHPVGLACVFMCWDVPDLLKTIQEAPAMLRLSPPPVPSCKEEYARQAVVPQEVHRHYREGHHIRHHQRANNHNPSQSPIINQYLSTRKARPSPPSPSEVIPHLPQGPPTALSTTGLLSVLLHTCVSSLEVAAPPESPSRVFLL